MYAATYLSSTSCHAHWCVFSWCELKFIDKFDSVRILVNIVEPLKDGPLLGKMDTETFKVQFGS